MGAEEGTWVEWRGRGLREALVRRTLVDDTGLIRLAGVSLDAAGTGGSVGMSCTGRVRLRAADGGIRVCTDRHGDLRFGRVGLCVCHLPSLLDRTRISPPGGQKCNPRSDRVPRADLQP